MLLNGLLFCLPALGLAHNFGNHSIKTYPTYSCQSFSRQFYADIKGGAGSYCPIPQTHDEARKLNLGRSQPY
jgi:hypothetical protein